MAYTLHNGVATINLAALQKVDEGKSFGKHERQRPLQYPWGTKVSEHRWFPSQVYALRSSIDACIKDTAVQCIVVAAEGKFWCNGVDLLWVDQAPVTEVADFNRALNALFMTVLTCPIPTVAALNGHWCAAGGMFGLCFDYRVMNGGRGYFFVPGVDLGIIYSSFQVELMKAKLPMDMWRKVLVYNSQRWTAAELAAKHVVDVVVVSDGIDAAKVTTAAVSLGHSLKPKGSGPARAAMGPIKRLVYRAVLEAFESAGGSEGGDGGLMEMSARKAGHTYAPPPSPSPPPTPPPPPTAAKL